MTRPGAVAPAHAVHAHRPVRLRDRAHRAAEVGVELLEDVEVRPFEVLGGSERGRVRLEQLAVRGSEPHEGNVHDLDRQVALIVLGDLLGEAQVDDARDAVALERLQIAQPPDVVGADDDAEARLAAVLGRDAAEVAHVEAALPLQSARHAGSPR